MTKFLRFLSILSLLGCLCSWANAQTVTLTIQNAQFVKNQSGVDSVYQFDIHFQADQSGLFLETGTVFLKYNTLAFGKFVSDSMGTTADSLAMLNKTYTFFSSTFNRYSDPMDSNPGGEDELSVSWTHENTFAFPPQAPNNSTHNEIPVLTSAPVARVTLAVATVGEAPGVDFDAGMDGGDIFVRNSDSAFLVNTNPVTLPVEFLAFSATQQTNQTVRLAWSTSREVNNNFFVVQRSSDAEFFESIGTVNAVGNSVTEQSYSFVDNDYRPQLSYYRLKQVDIDGTFAFSPIVRVLAQAVSFELFPNPVVEDLEINLTGPISQPYHMTVFDASGRQMMQQVFEGNTSRVTVSLKEWASGIYNYSIRQGQDIVRTGRLIKL